jgi:hypothetical protein
VSLSEGVFLVVLGALVPKKVENCWWLTNVVANVVGKDWWSLVFGYGIRWSSLVP